MLNQSVVVDAELFGSAKDRILAVACDGLGSCKGSDEASFAAICSMRDACKQKQDPISLCMALHRADDNVRKKQSESKELASIKTTIAVLYVDEEGFLAYNAGDTRIYHYNNGVLEQLSVDHTLSDDLQVLGESCERFNEGNNTCNQNIITQFLGSHRGQLKPYIAGDISSTASYGTFLLCTDGAYKGVPDEKIAEVLGYPAITLEQKGQLLYGLAEASGVRDNISLILVSVEEGVLE